MQNHSMTRRVARVTSWRGTCAALLVAAVAGLAACSDDTPTQPKANLPKEGPKTPAAVINYLKENATAVKNFAEYLVPGELSSVDDLKPGRGAIVRQGLSKVAAYRDEGGTLYTRSATCTHIGCHLHWNSFETCWDCPCHGSHFAVDGSVLNAPAISPLAETS